MPTKKPEEVNAYNKVQAALGFLAGIPGFSLPAMALKNDDVMKRAMSFGVGLLGKKQDQPGLDRYLGLRPLTEDDREFPTKDWKIDRMGEGFKELVEGLLPGGEAKKLDVSYGRSGVVEGDEEGEYSHWINPDGTDLSMTGSFPAGEGFSTGRYNIRVGKDENGVPYMEMGDTYDFHPEAVSNPIAKDAINFLNYLGTPFSYKSKYFFDPVTGQILK